MKLILTKMEPRDRDVFRVPTARTVCGVIVDHMTEVRIAVNF